MLKQNSSTLRIKILGGLLAVLLPALLFREELLRAAALPLIASDNNRIERADALYVLGGNLESRSFEAARMFHAGLAPLILMANEKRSRIAELGLALDGCEIAFKILHQVEGVPCENVVLIGPHGSVPVSCGSRSGPGEDLAVLPGVEERLRIGHVTSTLDEAGALRRWCLENPIRSVIVVTHSFHSGRVKRIFRKVLGESVRIRVATIDSHEYTACNWWQSEAGLIGFNNEWIKVIYYRMRY
jgi:hypothetical protein